MKKRTLISAILVLAMCFALACPTFAAGKDTTPPQWKQYGYESLADFLQAWEMTEDEYYEMVAEAVEEEAFVAAYLAANPGATEEEAEDAYFAEWYAAFVKEQRVAMGGPEDGVGVMLMDEYVEFPDAQPVIKNDRTMIPVRAVAEFTGTANVDWQDGTVILTTGLNKTITFRPGETTATVTDGTATTTFEMDVAPYIEQDRTYVPLRFFSQALGFEVYWDSDFRTAVILDSERMISEIDSNFTILNNLMKANKVDDTAYKTTGTMTGSLKMYDSEKGDKTANMTMDISGLSCGMNADVTIKMDMSELAAMLTSELSGEEESMSEEDAALLAAVSKTEYSALLNGETGKFYISSPALNALFPILTGSESQLPANTWFLFSFDAAMLGTLAGAEGMTVGSLIYEMSTASESVYSCESILETAQMLNVMMGDDCFTKTADGYTLKPDGIKEFVGESLDVCDIKMVFKNNGASETSIHIESDGLKFVMNVTGDQTKASATMLFDMQDMFAIDMKVNATAAKTTELPRTAPDKDALVLDLNTLDMSDILAIPTPAELGYFGF